MKHRLPHDVHQPLGAFALEPELMPADAAFEMFTPVNTSAPSRLDYNILAGLRTAQGRGQSKRGFRLRIAARHRQHPAAGSEIGHPIDARYEPLLPGRGVENMPAAWHRT